MLFPHTTSRRLAFRPASTAHHADLIRTMLRTGIENVSPTGRAGNRDLSKCDAAFLVTRRGSGDLLGFSTLHGLDAAGHIKSGVYLDPERARLGVGSEAIYLTINYAFAMFPIDRVIAQTTEATFGSVGLNSQDGSATAVLRDYLYFRGRHWDLHTYQLDRAEWEQHVDGDLDDVLGPGRSWRTDPNRPQAAA
ncbi:GNAT family N-acetyltransferase [Streptomyces sp. RS10V-4]|uniref:GNAT family N-acetyltransferase n=1 Tax=Streptomyces rhizoryzae TaxID=2932493 RepID=UPI0020054D34|nr:GNAT family protein [Streptomyces rhizoryzae]MCK7624215.1 GNAT family N-acetyltransferase [Streptomyces rhizoryzae]